MHADRHNIYEVSVLDTCHLGRCPYSNMTCVCCPFSSNYRSRWRDFNLNLVRDHYIQYYSFM